MEQIRRFPNRLRTVAVIAAALVLVTAGVAVARNPNAIHIITPQKADQITNIDILRSEIKNYYGTPTATTGSSCDQYLVSPANSNYSREATKVARAGIRWLRAQANMPHTGTMAIVFDVDDTTLTTWNYELCSNWDYNFTANSVFVMDNLFPATPGMLNLATKADKMGYAIFWITGRGTAQYDATLANLVSDAYAGYTAPDPGQIDAGYPAPTMISLTGPGGVDEPGLFTKPDVADYPAYLQAACASDPGGKCTTIHYKSATRAYIESQGFDIVASFGDQFSDLKGGYADRTFKMPNPNYYLP